MSVKSVAEFFAGIGLVKIGPVEEWEEETFLLELFDREMKVWIDGQAAGQVDRLRRDCGLRANYP